MQIDTWRTRFPEFYQGEDPYIESFLTAARLQVDASVWGELTEEGVGYLAAHLLCLTPSGQSAKLVAKDGSTVYGMRYREMLRNVAGGPRVL